MSDKYYKNLIKAVISRSESNEWKEAKEEWEVIYEEEDEGRTENCICGKEELKYLFKIRNIHNSNEIFPIGSECIKKFGVKDMKKMAELLKQERCLYEAIKNNAPHFKDKLSRSLINFLYDQGCFKPNKYNRFDGNNDREFLLEMFNKRNTKEISEGQKRKIKALIHNSIREFLSNKYEETNG